MSSDAKHFEKAPEVEEDIGSVYPPVQPPTSTAPATSPNNPDNLSFWTRNGLTADSFRRRTRATKEDGTMLDQSMKSRHLHMIAIGGSIGAGLFVGSGAALGKGGPGALIIDFCIIGIMIFNVVYALGELAVMYPISGGFYTYSSRFIDPSWGFAMGWNYVFQWAIVLPLELTVASITVSYWPAAANVSVGVWITVFFVAILILNIFGTLGYAEEEFWASLIKLIAVVIFMIIGLVLVLGGGPKSGRYNEYWGARYWYDPGAFANGFKGVCSVFVTAAFSFSGTELVGLAAAESANPAKALPGAIKQVFWRITLFYIVALLFVGLLIRYDDQNLLGANPFINVNAAPFVLVGKYANLKGFDSFMNAVIMISVISIGMSGVYGGSRTLTAMAEQGYAPRFLTYIDKSGRPLWSTLIIIAFGLLAYINLAAAGPKVFSWLQALSGLAALFTWGSICVAHIRFRAAWAHQGHSLDEIPFKAIGGVYGSWLGVILIVLVLIAQFYIGLFPIDRPPSAVAFFEAYLALPVVLLFWLGGYLWKKEGWLKLSQIDVDSGRRVVDLTALRKEQQRVMAMPMWKRALHHLF